MRARAYDSNTNSYFKSEVFAEINMGWYEKQLLLVPSDSGAHVRFFDYFDKSDPKEPKVLINMITPAGPAEEKWIYEHSGCVDTQLAAFAGLLNKGIRFFAYSGYPWIFADKSLMVELLNGSVIPVKGSVFEDKIFDSKISDWNYVETQSDVDFLLHQAYSFHDSVLKNLEYTSGAYVNDDKVMSPMNCIRQVIMRIDSQLCQPVEMVFEGVTALNLRPAGDNYSADIFEASLFVKDAAVFFCDEKINDIDETYDCITWIKAYSLRWRFIG